MIKSVRIKNFQKHATRRIKFNPKVTTIIGPTDIGKSSIIRALRWAILNKPRGESFLRDGATEVLVTLRTEHHTVKRRRGKTNTYALDGSKFTAFGSTVPDEISQVLNMSELNFEGQHDPSGFWFSMSPGEVSRKLNEIVDLSTIDTVLSNLSSKLRKSRTEETVIEERLTDLRGKRTKLRNAKKKDRALKKVEALAMEHSELKQSFDRLQARIHELGRAHEHLKQLRRKDAQYAENCELGQDWAKAQRSAAGLYNLIEKIKDAQQVLSAGVPNIRSLVRLGEKCQRLKEERTDLLELVLDAHSKRAQIKSLEADVVEYEAELEELMGEICPLCEQPV